MDPQAAWNEMLEAFASGNHDEAAKLADYLLNWLGRGGFPPQTSPSHRLPADWNRPIAVLGCQLVLDSQHEGSNGQ